MSGVEPFFLLHRRRSMWPDFVFAWSHVRATIPGQKTLQLLFLYPNVLEGFLPVRIALNTLPWHTERAVCFRGCLFRCACRLAPGGWPRRVHSIISFFMTTLRRKKDSLCSGCFGRG